MKKEDLLVLVAGLILVATFVLPAPNWDAGKKAGA
jgi:hypothetical protein